MAHVGKSILFVTVLVLFGCQGQTSDIGHIQEAKAEEKITLEKYLKDSAASEARVQSFQQTWKDGVKTCGFVEEDMLFSKGIIKNKLDLTVRWAHTEVISESEANECELIIDYAADGTMETKKPSCLCTLKKPILF